MVFVQHHSPGTSFRPAVTTVTGLRILCENSFHRLGNALRQAAGLGLRNKTSTR